MNQSDQNTEHGRLEVKNIEQSIDRMLKRASGQKDQTVKRDGIYLRKKI
jgi:hypothetical protein